MDRQIGKSAPVVSYAAPVPVVEWIEPSVSYVTPAPVDEHLAPAPALDAAPAPVVEFFSPAPVVYAGSAPVVDYIAPAPAVDGYISLAPAVYAAPAHVASYVARVPVVEGVAPTVSYVAPAPDLSSTLYFCLSPATSDKHISTPKAPRVKIRDEEAIPSGMRHQPSVAEKCDTRAARAVAARLGYMWRKSKQVERAACDRLLADMGAVCHNIGTNWPRSDLC